ncbi:guanitoxin biosynthesis heme-dependent pre-guanitoxin N-hydroxylase GntA [Novosphingobium sp. BL-8H]|uniref:guanitoxin biosynthesis heme-dependent pre-guanitoxin N-hydroxylase GntA n=1 Tax=Novosphingobium sp. BL-8H TaxID=3127640 RepID=UPI003757BEA7
MFSEAEAALWKKRFIEFVSSPAFPCVGAKSALGRGTLAIEICHSIGSSWDDLMIYDRLYDWSADYREDPSLFRSLAFVFANDEPLSEKDYERALWERVQSLTEKDAWLGLPYDERVSSDPSDPHFSLSFGGEAFFVVGMHPRASRPARRFARPVMVFNLHDQFEKLREQGRYEKIRETILERDVKIAGSINPMLARHGDASEASQYSGRHVGTDWRCPFHDPRNPEHSTS